MTLVFPLAATALARAGAALRARGASTQPAE